MISGDHTLGLATPQNFDDIRDAVPLTPLRERRTFANWRRIGQLSFSDAVISRNGDRVLHFNHPTWRDDRNDPATATRIGGRKVRTGDRR